MLRLGDTLVGIAGAKVGVNLGGPGVLCSGGTLASCLELMWYKPGGF